VPDRNSKCEVLRIGIFSHIKFENKAMMVSRLSQREVKERSFLRMWREVSLLLEKFKYFPDAESPPFLCGPLVCFKQPL
jgi:hypothetical protein